MDSTPRSERLHIAAIGKRNAGKSSLINLLTGQQTALVSDVPGTTTDPVYKAMEVHGIGPCVFIDTAGLDDSGPLGEMRVEATRKALQRADVVLMVFTDADAQEREWFSLIREMRIPTVPVMGKADLDVSPSGNGIGSPSGNWYPSRLSRITALCGEPPVPASATAGTGRDAIIAAILRKIPEDFGNRTITASLAESGDTVLLVMPQDIQAPKGRLILPQVQTLRELLDKGCSVMSCTADGMEAALKAMAAPPALIITDSQAFATAWKYKPAQSRLTSFSILFAGYKGDNATFLRGAEALSRLDSGSRVLIAEACTHVPLHEDIGRVKIPRLLRQRFGEGLTIDNTTGNDFPADLSGYDLIIHCGSCMFNRRYVLSRIASANAQSVPITNYGIALAWLNGILDKVVLPQ